MRFAIIALVAVVLATPAMAIECTSVEGKVMGEAISIKRSVKWNGGTRTLTLQSAKVSAGTLDGETMSDLKLACVLTGHEARCEAKDRKAAKVVDVSGRDIIEAWTLVSNGKEALRISYTCDADPIQFPDQFTAFSHADRHVVLHAQKETASFCSGKKIATAVSYEAVQAELDRVHARDKIDSMVDFEISVQGRNLLRLVETKLLRYPDAGCTTLLAALPPE